MYDDLKIAPLTSLDPQQVRQYGAKAANLGALAAIGMAVPPGVALGRDVLAYFLRENGIDLIALERTHSMGMVFFESAVKDAHEHQVRILEALTNGEFPRSILEKLDEALTPMISHPLAVRSSCVVEDSATTSFAGQYATLLDVNGRDDVLKAIRTCWASQYDGRVLKYAISRRGLPVLVPSMAVLIQRMLTPDHAGVCFTEGPTPKTRHLSIVESVPGLGEQLVSGARTPHNFEIDASGLVVNHRAPKKDMSAPPDNDIVKGVAEAARKIAAHFGKPQDIEWAAVGKNIYLLQARPITVLSGASKVSAALLPSASRSRSTGAAQTRSAQSEAVALREDLHDWLIGQIDPTLFRGAMSIVGSQSPTGGWEVEGNPEWNEVSTARIISLLVEGGVPASCSWTTHSGFPGGPAVALAWLAARVKVDGTWGTDLWDTCQVVRTLLCCGVTADQSLIQKAAERVREGLLGQTHESDGQEWFGTGFYAAALQMFSELGDADSATQCTDRLISSQSQTGDFTSGTSQVPSEWHTAQVISALASSKDAAIRQSVARAREWLLARQQADGSWGAADGPYQHFKTFFTGYAVLALLDSGKDDRGAVAKACRWLKQRQSLAGSFGDAAFSLMAVAALQRYHGPAFSLSIPIAMFMRVQAYLSASIQASVQ